jgi:hypothetical protein
MHIKIAPARARVYFVSALPQSTANVQVRATGYATCGGIVCAARSTSAVCATQHAQGSAGLAEATEHRVGRSLHRICNEGARIDGQV